MVISSPLNPYAGQTIIYQIENNLKYNQPGGDVQYTLIPPNKVGHLTLENIVQAAQTTWANPVNLQQLTQFAASMKLSPNYAKNSIALFDLNKNGVTGDIKVENALKLFALDSASNPQGQVTGTIHNVPEAYKKLTAMISNRDPKLFNKVTAIKNQLLGIHNSQVQQQRKKTVQAPPPPSIAEVDNFLWESPQPANQPTSSSNTSSTQPQVPSSQQIYQNLFQTFDKINNNSNSNFAGSLSQNQNITNQ